MQGLPETSASCLQSTHLQRADLGSPRPVLTTASQFPSSLSPYRFGPQKPVFTPLLQVNVTFTSVSWGTWSRASSTKSHSKFHSVHQAHIPPPATTIALVPEDFALSLLPAKAPSEGSVSQRPLPARAAPAAPQSLCAAPTAGPSRVGAT